MADCCAAAWPKLMLHQLQLAATGQVWTLLAAKTAWLCRLRWLLL